MLIRPQAQDKGSTLNLSIFGEVRRGEACDLLGAKVKITEARAAHSHTRCADLAVDWSGGQRPPLGVCARPALFAHIEMKEKCLPLRQGSVHRRRGNPQ